MANVVAIVLMYYLIVHTTFKQCELHRLTAARIVRSARRTSGRRTELCTRLYQYLALYEYLYTYPTNNA